MSQRDKSDTPVRWTQYTIKVGPIGHYPASRSRETRDELKAVVAKYLALSPRTRSPVLVVEMHELGPNEIAT